jgi:biotin synthase
MSISYEHLAVEAIEKGSISPEEIKWILEGDDINLLSLLDAAYKVRRYHFENKVKIHIINNVQSGNCSEDCSYCAQSKEAPVKSETYPMKSDTEILEEAEFAHQNGAYRYCMVFSGRDLGKNRIERITSVVRKIKEKYRMEICVSAGFLSEQDAATLKKAGVDRYNHNLNTSREHYNTICRSHDYRKRLGTIQTARENGLDICSGLIIGMGETSDDIVSAISDLRDVKANSIPVNFFIPIEGHRIENPRELTPHYCLRVLCAFRLALPRTEIRAAGGREYHLRSLQALSLFAVNSLFSKGYLTTGGESVEETKQMIVDNGFILDHIEY